MVCLLDPQKVIGECLETAFELKKYCCIVETVSKDDFKATQDFRKTFNGYYRLQRRTASWYERYYDLFEKQKKKQLSYQALLEEMYDCAGKIEVSFVSKMIASIDTSKPIWDQYVLKNLGLEKEWNRTYGANPEARISEANNIYSKIIESYGDILCSSKGQECITRFHQILPDYVGRISDVKIIDFFLWSKR